MRTVALCADIRKTLLFPLQQAGMNGFFADLVIRVTAPARAGGHDLELLFGPEPSRGMFVR